MERRESRSFSPEFYRYGSRQVPPVIFQQAPYVDNRSYGYDYQDVNPLFDNRGYRSSRRAPADYGDRYPDYSVQGPTYYSSNGNDYSGGYYDSEYADYDNGGDWKQQILRMVIGAFMGGGTDRGYLANPYTSYAYGPYTENAYDYAPLYSNYSNRRYAGDAYQTVSYGYDPNLNVIDPTPFDGMLSVLPYGDTIDLYSGGLAAELIQRALGTGYYQGLLEGQVARKRGWNDRYYNDPYAYYDGEQMMFDPYSSSIGDCRRMYSEGYELGYQDALAGRADDYEQLDGGNVDLVSMLIGSVLDFRS
ncbi:MAG: hypothetical protein ABR535_02515 [Pyrinomonadaceae bacterium]